MVILTLCVDGFGVRGLRVVVGRQMVGLGLICVVGFGFDLRGGFWVLSLICVVGCV